MKNELQYYLNTAKLFCWAATIKFPRLHIFPDLSLTLGIFADLSQFPWQFQVSTNSLKVVTLINIIDYYLFTTPEGMEGCVGLDDWHIADSLATTSFTCQPQITQRTQQDVSVKGRGRRPNH